MVHILSLALLGLTLSVLGVTTQNDRRGVDVLSRARLSSRGEAVMGLHARQDDEQAISAVIKKLEEERRVISPEFDKAWEKVKTTAQAAEDAISAEHKENEKKAVKALEAAFFASDDSIPQELKQKQEDAISEFEAVKDGLSEETKSKLEENRLAIEEAWERESASEPDSDSDSPSASATAPSSTSSVAPKS